MTLLLRLEGPLQSWGYRSKFRDRDTGLEPTKSGVIGLLCCALGRDRSESPADLAALAMHVRVDREGKLLTDFQTAGGGTFRGSKNYFAPKVSGGTSENPILIDRHYLQDASFLVALEGEAALLKTLAEAIKDPRWPLALGRRSCPPSAGVFVNDPVDHPALELLRTPDADPQAPLNVKSVRLVRELPQGDLRGEPRADVPIRWANTLDRQYAIRFVVQESIILRAEVPA